MNNCVKCQLRKKRENRAYARLGRPTAARWRANCLMGVMIMQKVADNHKKLHSAHGESLQKEADNGNGPSTDERQKKM